jgi:hypothetical protein
VRQVVEGDASAAVAHPALGQADQCLVVVIGEEHLAVGDLGGLR